VKGASRHSSRDLAKKKPPEPKRRAQQPDRLVKTDWLIVRGARHNNLKNIDVGIPLGRFVCVTGVSGSGKSSLVVDILRERLARDLNGATTTHPGRHASLLGLQHLDKVIDIDQSPIGRTPRSNPATYIKAFDEIRALYARLPDSKVRGYKPGRFSFNVPAGEAGGGRCEACEGNGANRVEMDFLADVWVACPVCNGRRFNQETLQIRYRSRSIHDVLEMDVQQAIGHFEAIPKIRAMLTTLHDVGLDYLKLGQSSTTLSGGEAQRIKLARELVKRATGRTLYILDEPTTGLHFEDIRRLLAVLHGFVDAGNTVVVIEHNLDVIKTADWVIDLGPEGGEAGGYVVAEGTPEQVAACGASFTGQALAPLLLERTSDPCRARDGDPNRASASRQSRDSKGAVHVIGRRTAPSRSRLCSETLRAGATDENGVASKGGDDRGIGFRSQVGIPGDALSRASTWPPRQDEVLVVGAKENNLRDVTVGIPRGRMTVCTGVSGSGKTSFALDTVYTEGQRRYIESLSAYARQFLGRLQKPKVDHIHGLSPAIAIEQKAATKSPRSTVGTVTEIYDYMRVLWARVGRPHCPKCEIPIGTQTSDEIVDKIVALPTGSRLLLCAPIERSSGESWDALLDRCRGQGYVRVRVDGLVSDLAETPRLDARRRQAVELVVDRVVLRADARRRIADSIEHCLALGQGVMIAVPADADLDARQPTSAGERPRRRSAQIAADHTAGNTAAKSPDAAGIMRFSQHLSCDRCGASYDELTPHHLSFNSRLGWCPSCEGLGVQHGARADQIIVRPDRSILDGAVAGWEGASSNPLLHAMLVALAGAIGFDPTTPCNDLDPEHRRRLLFGTGDRWIECPAAASPGLQPGRRVDRADPKQRPGRRSTASGRQSLSERRTDARLPVNLRFQWKGFFPAIDEATRISWEYRAKLQEMVTEVDCQACGGGRINPQAAALRLGGRSIIDVCAMTLTQAAGFFKVLKLDRRQARIAGELLHEIKSRLRFLVDVGLGYLTLGRSAPTLSGGESQRIRLASQIGSGLTGVLYVLDEPTIGLHPRDNRRLIAALHKLRDLGNTLLVVEHDREVIATSDHLLDFGPGAGSDGGQLVDDGPPAELKRRRNGLTAKYLAGAEAIAVPTNRRSVAEPLDPRQPRREDQVVPALLVVGARQNNLRCIDVAFPLGRFTCVTGVSGSGKSSLVTEILYPALAARIHRARATPGAHERILGLDFVDKVINVDQQPIGNSPLSNAATYTGVFDLIREVFARLPESKMRGYTINRFSFNRPGGRCDDCEGLGQICHEMHFLPDVWVPCETCGGTRYQRETLEIRYKGRNIADVLAMPAAEALAHFANVPKVRRLLQMLDDVGLGYLPLGQSAPTLSGGEAQRVKLAAELARPNTGKTVYILDEPTTGLHFDDLRKLLNVLHRLVDLGNAVICIEHNLDVIKTADWVIDLGPEAGQQGGTVVAAGTPEDVAQAPASHTGRLLKEILAAGPRRPREVFDPKKAAAKALASDAPDVSTTTASEPSARLPWQIDGQRWHTEQRRSRDGKTVEWEGAALTYIVDQIERLGGDRLLPTDWNDRARVEIRPKAPDGLAQSATPWFCHALTGGRWLLDLLLRVPQGTFRQGDLLARLKLQPLSEHNAIPAYGDTPRVIIRPAPNNMDQLRVLVYDRKEVATPAFKAFLKQALVAHLAHLATLAADAASGEPWKAEGKAWHLSQRSIPADEPKRWKPATLAATIGLVNKTVPNARTLWGRKVFVDLLTADGRRIGKIITNKSEGLRMDVHVPRGRFTPTQVERLGTSQEFARPGSSGAELTFWFESIEQLDPVMLKSVLQAASE